MDDIPARISEFRRQLGADPDPEAERGERPALPDSFLPAPTRLRADGWTPDRQRAFVEHLANCGCVSHAAAHVGMTKQSAYALRRRAPNSMFAFAWDAAIKLARPQLHDMAVERALDGSPVPVFHRGEQVGERRVYNDRLLMFLLTQGDKLDRVTIRRPDRPALAGDDADHRSGLPAAAGPRGDRPDGRGGGSYREWKGSSVIDARLGVNLVNFRSLAPGPRAAHHPG